MASLAQFYYQGELKQAQVIDLDEPTAKHIVQVLRKHAGDRVMLVNGKGSAAEAVITGTAKKKCSVKIDSVVFHKEPALLLHLAVAFTKNTSRNEWLLEKATELGVRSIIPLSTARTEKEHFKEERWNNILLSAMLQSQQYYLPELSKPVKPNEVVNRYGNIAQKLVAHCMEGREKLALPIAMKTGNETILLIGPEGDFTEEEVALFEGHGFVGVSLGKQRLRTETAAMAACAYFNMINNAE